MKKFVGIGMNNVLVAGNVVADGEFKEFENANGRGVTTFTVAVNRRYKSGEEWKETTTFVPVKYYGSNRPIKKGESVIVEGEFAVDSWQAEDGTNKTFSYVKASSIKKVMAEIGDSAVDEEDADIPF